MSVGKHTWEAYMGRIKHAERIAGRRCVGASCRGPGILVVNDTYLTSNRKLFIILIGCGDGSVYVQVCY